jgi:hypothetical protein
MSPAVRQALLGSVHHGSDCCGWISRLSNQHPDDLSSDLALRLHLPSTTIAKPDISGHSLMYLGRATNLNLSAKELSIVWMPQNGTGWIAASVGHGVEPLF